METQVKRRYSNPRSAEYKYYNDTFDRFLILSDILNSQNPIGNGSIIWDRPAIEAEIVRRSTQLIPDIEKLLKEVETTFKEFCERQVNQGHRKPESWPQHLLEKRLYNEAWMDITKREIEVLNEQLHKRFIEPIKQADEKTMLARGPIGIGEMRNSILILIDGQTVEKINDQMVITSEKSPYKGMSVADYREFVIKPWTITKRKRAAELERQRADEIRKTGKSSINVSIGNKVIDRSSLPPWPDGVPNLLVNNSTKSAGSKSGRAS